MSLRSFIVFECVKPIVFYNEPHLFLITLHIFNIVWHCWLIVKLFAGRTQLNNGCFSCESSHGSLQFSARGRNSVCSQSSDDLPFFPKTIGKKLAYLFLVKLSLWHFNNIIHAIKILLDYLFIFTLSNVESTRMCVAAHWRVKFHCCMKVFHWHVWTKMN